MEETTCPVCSYSNKSASAVFQHMRNVHNSPNVNIPSAFTTKHGLIQCGASGCHKYYKVQRMPAHNVNCQFQLSRRTKAHPAGQDRQTRASRSYLNPSSSANSLEVTASAQPEYETAATAESFRPLESAIQSRGNRDRGLHFLNEYLRRAHPNEKPFPTKKERQGQLQFELWAPKELICTVEFISKFANFLATGNETITKGGTGQGYLSGAVSEIQDLFGKTCFEQVDTEAINNRNWYSSLWKTLGAKMGSKNIKSGKAAQTKAPAASLHDLFLLRQHFLEVHTNRSFSYHLPLLLPLLLLLLLNQVIPLLLLHTTA